MATELLFYAAPFLLMLSLLLAGRYIGEERILARRVAKPRLRPAKRRWTAARELPLASLLERSPRLDRGPPRLGLSA
jgi:hypothetical protein